MNQKDTPVSPLYYKILVTLMLALSIILGVWAAYSHLSARAYRTALQNTYCRAADSAADNLANLSDDLVKGMYTGSSPQLSQICARLWKESAAAKSFLSALPLESTLSATNKFLSQAGDYAMYLSRKTANGSPLTEEERSSFASLREYADRLSVQLDDLACSLQNGSLTIEQLQASDKDASAFAVHADGDDRLRQLEDSFTGYPTLIYDGPFSDHLLEKTPQMTRDKPAITPEQAKAIAARVTDRPLPQLRREDSVLPCYVLHDGKNNSVAITRQGGFLCYLVTAKPEALTARLSYQQAVDKAQQFLQAQGYSSMKDTYYETTDGVMTLNFAYLDPATQTICYTDLIKVEISLQDGSILGLDARGYLVNHHQRQLAFPTAFARAGAANAQSSADGGQRAPCPHPHLRQKRSGGVRIFLHLLHRRPGAVLYQHRHRRRGTAVAAGANSQRHPDQINKTPSANLAEGVLFFAEKFPFCKDILEGLC